MVKEWWCDDKTLHQVVWIGCGLLGVPGPGPYVLRRVPTASVDRMVFTREQYSPQRRLGRMTWTVLVLTEAGMDVVEFDADTLDEIDLEDGQEFIAAIEGSHDVFVPDGETVH